MKKILVVENHPVALKLLVEFLKRQGHEVITAEDGLAALKILQQITPDLIFTDLIMPNINGEKLCQIIRNRTELKHLPIIIYSATELEDEINILKLGADVCIAKGPFKNTETHIALVIKHIDNGTLHELKGQILGGESLYKRHITSELLFARRHYEHIINSLPEGVIECTLDGTIFHVNTAALTLCGLGEENLLSSCFFDLFLEKDREQLRTLLNTVGPEPLIINETAPLLLNNKMITIHFLPSIDETRAFVVAIMRDITEHKQMEERLRESALTDELTGLFNRRGFMTLAKTLLKISARDNTDLLLVYADFDNLKWINDTLGHTIGDQALIEVATLLQDTFRLADVVGRLGGDEFVILYTDNSAIGNEETIRNRLSKSIEKANRMTTRQYPLSLSVGMGRYEHLAPCSIDDLLHQADRAMYKNKAAKKARHQDGYNH
ncbi:MAG TPA: hypothetical protein DEQ20_03915 [Desulfobulbaceae bacterium]|nr:MAG: hypothetical protein A2520_05985 [Deltaproteobacteria bacterium RIFOXYD12_FULL_53_23]HCC54060.1 hypothetical protein [Desulfobulbaceae bacterium]